MKNHAHPMINKNHAHPMINAISSSYTYSEKTEITKISDRFVFAVGDWGHGHVAPDASDIAKILSLVINGKYNGDEIASDIRKMIPKYFS